MEKISARLDLRNCVEATIDGFMLSGCPHESSSGCVFENFRPETMIR
jgi:hypothetical protein